MLSTLRNLLHLGSSRAPALPAPCADPRTADLQRQTADTLEPVYSQSTLEASGERMTFSSPALGGEALQLKRLEDGSLRATQAGQDLKVEHEGAYNFYSSSGALGNMPGLDRVELPNGRSVSLREWSKGSWQVNVEQPGSAVSLDLRFRTSEEFPTSAAFRQTGLEVAVSPREGLRLEQHPRCDGPLYGRLTTWRSGTFETRNWSDGFSSASSTTEDDIAKVLSSSRQLLADGGALFAPTR